MIGLAGFIEITTAARMIALQQKSAGIKSEQLVLPI